MNDEKNDISKAQRMFDFLERHNKKIIVFDIVVLGAFLLKPKVVYEIAKYRELQINAFRAVEMIDEVGDMVMTIGDQLLGTGELRNAVES